VEEGIITKHVFDLNKKALTMRVEVFEGNSHSTYNLEFVQVSRFLYEGENTHEWEKLELTELQIEKNENHSVIGTLDVTFNFWDVAQLVLQCAAIIVDGNLLREEL